LLWDVVKIAKDANVSKLPKVMYNNGIAIQEVDLPHTFASFFRRKIKDIVDEVRIDDQVYNGGQKGKSPVRMFFDPVSVKEVMMLLKIKNSEGFDRIPQRIIVDGVEILALKFVKLFELIYN
jgi:hypothetical protein